MKVFSRLSAIIISLILILSITISTSAATVDLAQTGSNTDIASVSQKVESAGTKLEPTDDLPSSYSSRESGYVGVVRDQIANTCWAYGSLSTLETALLKLGFEVTSFAPMHMNHWGTIRPDGTGWARNEYSGGYAYISLGYLTSWQGPRLESDYNETTPHAEYNNLDPIIKKQAQVNGIIYLDADDITTVKTAIYNYGAALGNYHVDDSMYNPATYAYYCNSEELQTYQLNGHAISIVGWDDNFSRDNFREDVKPQNDGAWLCKNSWGEYWGDNGYYWISYEDNYLFDTRFGHSYAFTDVDVYDETYTLYQNEIDGATYEFESISNMDVLTYINVFDAQDGFETIDKVNFETTSTGAEYTIYSIPLKADNTPDNNKNNWKAIGNGTVSYNGYISVDTEDFDVKNEKFAIGVELTKRNGSKNGIGVTEWLTAGGSRIFTPQSTRGMSYILYGGSYVIDVMDFYRDYLADDIGGTFVIKAVGKEKAVSKISGDVDLDGIISVMDATYIQRVIAQIETISGQALINADTDSDGVLSIMDATRIQKKLAGHITDFEDTFN